MEAPALREEDANVWADTRVPSATSVSDKKVYLWEVVIKKGNLEPNVKKKIRGVTDYKHDFVLDEKFENWSTVELSTNPAEKYSGCPLHQLEYFSHKYNFIFLTSWMQKTILRHSEIVDIILNPLRIKCHKSWHILYIPPFFLKVQWLRSQSPWYPILDHST